MKVLTSNNSYNSGLFANAACALYEVTGDPQYMADAILAANQKVNKEPISNENHVNNGYFGAEQLVRAVARIASQVDGVASKSMATLNLATKFGTCAWLSLRFKNLLFMVFPGV